MKTEIKKKEEVLFDNYATRVYEIYFHGKLIVQMKFATFENDLTLDYFFLDEEDPELLELFFYSSAREMFLEISILEKYSLSNLLSIYYKGYINYLLTNNCYMEKEEIKANLITKEEVIDMGITGKSFSEVLGQIIAMCRSSLRPLRQYNGCFISIYKNTPDGKKIISQRRIYSIDDKEILLTLQFDENDIQRMI